MNMHHIIKKETINLLYTQRIFSGLSDTPLTQKTGVMSQVTIHSTFPQDSWYLEQAVWVGRCQSDYVTQQLLVVVKNEARRHLRHSATLDHVLRELGRLSPHEAHNALVCFPRGHLVSGGSGENVQVMR